MRIRFYWDAFNGVPVSGSQFVVPGGHTAPVTLVANFERHATASTTHSIDSQVGDDALPGISPDSPGQA